MRVAPERLRHAFFQLELDRERVLAGRKAGAVADAEDMRVYGEGFLPKSGVEHDVRGLPADTGQCLQLLPR